MQLSICLPVRNDADALEQTIGSLLGQWQNGWEDMEIIVSDNASEDDSFTRATALLSKMSQGKVLRQESNLGFAGNLAFLAQQAKGDYIWFIGAGDSVRQNGLEAVRQLIASGNPDWGVIGGTYSHHPPGQLVPLKIGAIHGSPDRPNKVPVFSIAISLNFFRRRLLMDYTFTEYRVSPAEAVEAPGQEDIWKDEIHCWPHIESILQFAENFNGESYCWAYSAEDIVDLDRNKNGSWNERPSVLRIYAQWLDLVIELLRVMPNSAWLKNESKRLATTHLWEYAFSIRLKQLLSPGDLVRQLPKKNVGFSSRVVVWVVAHTPHRLLRIISKANGIRKLLWKK